MYLKEEILEEKKEVIKLNKKEREEGIELLRILTMFMILILHYCGKGEFLKNSVLENINVELAWIAEAFSIVAVNCYILISGYFLVNSSCNRIKIIKIIGTVWFYSIVIFAIFKAFIGIEISLKESLFYIFPVTLKTYWFITCYILLYLLAPYINIVLKNVDRDNLLILIYILFGVTFGSSILLRFGYPAIDYTNGYGIIWFITLYCIGGYIRLYKNDNYNKYKYLILYCLISIFAYLSRVIMLLFTTKLQNVSNLFYNYDSITIVLSSICLFLFFKKVRISNKYIKRAILRIAPLTLAVYIIHEHPLIRSVLYTKVLHTELFIQSNKFVIALLLSCLGIFIICCLIEGIRKYFLKQVKKIYNKYLEKYIHKYLIKFQKKMQN